MRKIWPAKEGTASRAVALKQLPSSTNDSARSLAVSKPISSPTGHESLKGHFDAAASLLQLECSVDLLQQLLRWAFVGISHAITQTGLGDSLAIVVLVAEKRTDEQRRAVVQCLQSGVVAAVADHQ
ncbi:hypothetical protein TYRP_016934 [Tyrophagus putrescentiae]|nr:hypothetical protein TYRP_002024 [Tyrophagus putrescentiae]KAH9401540.1 hypothetical protein TYRP_016934 [Tyrophagus putrescentiae]